MQRTNGWVALVVAVVLVLGLLWVMSWSWQEKPCSARHLCTPRYMQTHERGDL